MDAKLVVAPSLTPGDYNRRERNSQRTTVVAPSLTPGDYNKTSLLALVGFCCSSLSHPGRLQ